MPPDFPLTSCPPRPVRTSLCGVHTGTAWSPHRPRFGSTLGAEDHHTVFLALFFLGSTSKITGVDVPIFSP